MAKIWITPTSSDGERQLKQHCFKPVLSSGLNIRNKSLCGNLSIFNEDYKSALWSDLKYQGEWVIESACCKKCLEIYNKNI